MKASIGYYGNPNGRHTKVHVVENGKPICGCKIDKGMIFQWCAYLFSGVTNSYVECEHCRRKLRNESLM
jgi:hypothetical protein